MCFSLNLSVQSVLLRLVLLWYRQHKQSRCIDASVSMCVQGRYFECSKLVTKSTTHRLHLSSTNRATYPIDGPVLPSTPARSAGSLVSPPLLPQGVPHVPQPECYRHACSARSCNMNMSRPFYRPLPSNPSIDCRSCPPATAHWVLHRPTQSVHTDAEPSNGTRYTRLAGSRIKTMLQLGTPSAQPWRPSLVVLEMSLVPGTTRHPAPVLSFFVEAGV